MRDYDILNKGFVRDGKVVTFSGPERVFINFPWSGLSYDMALTWTQVVAKPYVHRYVLPREFYLTKGWWDA